MNKLKIFRKYYNFKLFSTVKIEKNNLLLKNLLSIFTNEFIY